MSWAHFGCNGENITFCTQLPNKIKNIYIEKEKGHTFVRAEWRSKLVKLTDWVPSTRIGDSEWDSTFFYILNTCKK